MQITPLYTAEAVSTGEGRDGHVRTDDGRLDFDVSIPQEMGGKGGATNPEQLFAAAYSACFHSALRASAQKAQVTLPSETSVTARVSLGTGEDGGYGLQVAMTARLAVALVRTAQPVLLRPATLRASLTELRVGALADLLLSRAVSRRGPPVLAA